MALIKSYLICWAAIITISMGADNWIELTKPPRSKARMNIAMVQGHVQFWGPELRRSSTSGSAMEEEGVKIHEVREAKMLKLVPECTLSAETAEHNVFTFKGRFEDNAAWLYSDTITTTQESISRTAANKQIKMLSEAALRKSSHYLVWTVDCEAGLNGIIPKKFQEFSHEICKITITAPKYTATKTEILDYEKTEEERFPGRKPRALCEIPKPALPLPPNPAEIVAALSRAHGARGADTWKNSYWNRFSTYLTMEDNHVVEIGHFLHEMIPLIRKWNERHSHVIDYTPITPTNAKNRMTQIFDRYIDNRGDETINIMSSQRKTLAKWADKRPPWTNEEGELQIVPTGSEWTRVVNSQIRLLKNRHLKDGWYNSELYKNWVDTSYGQKYKKLRFKWDREKEDSKLIKKKKRTTAATASGVSHESSVPGEPYKVGSALILSQKGPSTKTKPVGIFKALESYYNNIYDDMGYYGYDGFDEYDEGYDDNDVTAAYWRGYVNGLLSRLNK